MEDGSGVKGVGRSVMSLYGDDGRVTHLVSHDDGSWSVQRDGQVCGTFEAHETKECLRAFLRQGGGGPVSVVLVRRSIVPGHAGAYLN